MDDGFYMVTGQLARLVIDGTEYAFRRPTFGELRKIAERNEARVAAELSFLRDARDAEQSAAEDQTADDKIDQTIAQVHATQMSIMASLEFRLEYWRDVAALLGLTLPPTDMLPPWLGNIDLIEALTTFWVADPTVAPGSTTLGAENPDGGTDR